jgi:hypothetical protein
MQSRSVLYTWQTCAVTSGVPADVGARAPHSSVTYSNIKVGPIKLYLSLLAPEYLKAIWKCQVPGLARLTLLFNTNRIQKTNSKKSIQD